MLKEFRFKNYRSFKNEQVLSLEPMEFENKLLDDFNISESGLLKSAIIYGHNSYGKSNIFKALSQMKRVIIYCTHQDFKIDADNFKLDSVSFNMPTLFEISIKIEDNFYRYGFEVLKEKIVKEWLYKNEDTKVFERGGSLNTSIELGEEYSRLNKFIEFTRENELFFSSMVRNNEQDEIKKIYDWIVENIVIFSAEEIFSGLTSELFINKKLNKEEILKALKCADLGIEDFEVKKEEEKSFDFPPFIEKIIKEVVKEQSNSEGKFYRTEEITKHSVYDENREKIEEIEFNFLEKESSGTIKFYSILGPILDTLKNGKVLFIDELDSKLEHNLTKYIIELFHNLSSNRKNAQLIFNTHDFYFINSNIFRRDQIYVVDKNRYGESTLDSFGDFEGVDDETNLLKNYLANNFGGIGKIKKQKLMI